MDVIEYGKKYLVSYENHTSEAVYLGRKLKKNMKNKHFFMIWHPSLRLEDRLPVLITCQDFNISEGNRLETLSTKRYFPRISKKEEECLAELAKKYWK